MIPGVWLCITRYLQIKCGSRQLVSKLRFSCCLINSSQFNLRNLVGWISSVLLSLLIYDQLLFYIISHLRFKVPLYLFIQNFPLICCHVLVPPLTAKCSFPVHVGGMILNIIWRSVQIMRVSIMSFSQFCVSYSPLEWKHSFRTLLSDTISLHWKCSYKSLAPAVCYLFRMIWYDIWYITLATWISLATLIEVFPCFPSVVRQMPGYN
jgi:hypothetical protein